MFRVITSGRAAALAVALSSSFLVGVSPAVSGGLVYTYDEVGRVTRVTYPSGLNVTYEYDDAGNRTAKRVSNIVVNRPPVAVTDYVDLNAGTLPTSVYVSPLANDSDPDGDTLTITSITAATDGAVATISGNRVSVTKISASGTSFNYTVSDGKGGAATATVWISISCYVNKAGETICQ